jgi:hypothetical protein
MTLQSTFWGNPESISKKKCGRPRGSGKSYCHLGHLRVVGRECPECKRERERRRRERIRSNSEEHERHKAKVRARARGWHGRANETPERREARLARGRVTPSKLKKKAIAARNREFSAIQKACEKAWRDAAKIRRLELTEARRLELGWQEQRRREAVKRAVEYQRWKLDNDPEFKLKQYIKKGLRQRIKSAGAKKSDHTLPLVGCSISFLMVYLEQRFEPGMAWNNYGKVWHIDHVIPCASFDLLKPSQQRKCFHYTNLQPLFGPANRSKGARTLKQWKLFS